MQCRFVMFSYNVTIEITTPFCYDYAKRQED